MLTRRDFVQAVAAASAIAGGAPGRAAAQGRLSQDDLLAFKATGQVTLLHFTDIHAHITPLHFREPSVNIGVGEVAGLPPHLTGGHLLKAYGLKAGSPEAFAFTANDFTTLARSHGRIGGLDRMATLVKAIRAERPGKVLLLDGGDTWQGTYVALREKGGDMVEAMNALGVEAMTAHWEFTYGAERVLALKDKLRFPFLCGNVKDSWNDEVFDAATIFERGGLRIGVIGQAFPYTPIANPRYMIPDWSFGIEEDRVRARVAKLRETDKVDLVVLLSHNGFDVDRKLAARVPGIDVILTGHTHDAIPDLVKVGSTLLVASGSHGKFLARLDLEIRDRRVVGHAFRLIPVFADVIRPDAEMTAVIDRIRAPHKAALSRVLGRTETLLYRRGNFGGTFDDLIGRAILEERDAQIALSPGFRWGASLLPGQDITLEDVHTQTAITYPAVYRNEMTGKQLKDVLEDVADNLFNPDPYYQQGGDMVRSAGLAYTIDVTQPIGRRISDMRLAAGGAAIDPTKTYIVAGWASINEAVQGPPIYDLVANWIEKKKTVSIPEASTVTIRGADPRGMAL